MNGEAYIRRSKLQEQDIAFLASAEVLHFLALQDLEFSVKELLWILKLRIEHLSIRGCFLRDYDAFSEPIENDTIRDLVIELNGMSSECLSELIRGLKGLETLNIVNHWLSLDDLQALTAAKLRRLDISNCYVDEFEGIQFTKVDHVEISEAVLAQYPNFALCFPNAEIDVIGVILNFKAPAHDE